MFFIFLTINSFILFFKLSVIKIDFLIKNKNNDYYKTYYLIIKNMQINPLSYLLEKINAIMQIPLLSQKKASEAAMDVLNFIVKEKRPFNLSRRIVHLNLKLNESSISSKKIKQIWQKIEKL